jgi:hypothetical protein
VFQALHTNGKNEDEAHLCAQQIGFVAVKFKCIWPELQIRVNKAVNTR